MQFQLVYFNHYLQTLCIQGHTSSSIVCCIINCFDDDFSRENLKRSHTYNALTPIMLDLGSWNFGRILPIENIPNNFFFKILHDTFK